MSFSHSLWLSTGSTLNPMTLQFRFLNSGSSFAIYPNSVVQTGVKSLGCEKRIAHPSPIQSWNVMDPLVVGAVKFGAVSLIRIGMVNALIRIGCSIREIRF